MPKLKSVHFKLADVRRRSLLTNLFSFLSFRRKGCQSFDSSLLICVKYNDLLCVLLMRVNVLRIVDVVVCAHGIRCVTSSVLSRGLKSFPYSRLDVFDIWFGATRIFFITQWCGSFFSSLFHSFVSFLLLFVARQSRVCAHRITYLAIQWICFYFFRSVAQMCACVMCVRAWMSSVIHLGLWKSSWE